MSCALIAMIYSISEGIIVQTDSVRKEFRVSSNLAENINEFLEESYYYALDNILTAFLCGRNINVRIEIRISGYDMPLDYIIKNPVTRKWDRERAALIEGVVKECFRSVKSDINLIFNNSSE